MSNPPSNPSTLVKEVVNEAGKALDSLSALSVELSCQGRGAPQTLVLPASRVAEACATIDEAVTALKRILRIGDESGNGPLPLGG